MAVRLMGRVLSAAYVLHPSSGQEFQAAGGDDGFYPDSVKGYGDAPRADSTAYDRGYRAPAERPAEAYGYRAPADRPAEAYDGYRAPAERPAEAYDGYRAPAERPAEAYGYRAPAERPAEAGYGNFGNAAAGYDTAPRGYSSNTPAPEYRNGYRWYNDDPPKVSAVDNSGADPAGYDDTADLAYSDGLDGDGDVGAVYGGPTIAPGGSGDAPTGYGHTAEGYGHAAAGNGAASTGSDGGYAAQFQTLPPTSPPPMTTLPYDGPSTTTPNHGAKLEKIPGSDSFQDAWGKPVKDNLATESWSDMYVAQPDACTDRFRVRPNAPELATDLNGVKLPVACFQDDTKGLHHVFLIGDWGGIFYAMDIPPVPADHRAKEFAGHHRPFVKLADDWAQINVSKQMSARALIHEPDYIINLGDNFYWGGVNVQCGSDPADLTDPSHQWEFVYERIYKGPGISGKQWLGTLGNHDYGGFMFTSGWDTAISYTWAKFGWNQNGGENGRWMTPALYYSAEARYTDFSVEYFFLDSNVFDAYDQDLDQWHNLCSRLHNYPGATCGALGPASTDECPMWFKKLWDAEVIWLRNNLAKSIADWQIVVTHFPPEHGTETWKSLTEEFGVDLMMTAHRHIQEVHGQHDKNNMLRPTTYVVTGGGGGITSEGPPQADGQDDQYGFMDMTLSKHELMITAISHGGQIRSTTCVLQRHKGGEMAELSGTSLCQGIPFGTQPLVSKPIFT